MRTLRPILCGRAAYVAIISPGAPQGELLQSTLLLLILRTLATGSNHGFALARRIQRCIEWSSTASWTRAGALQTTIDKAKYYRLTKRGTRELASETERWNSIVAAIATALQEG